MQFSQHTIRTALMTAVAIMSIIMPLKYGRADALVVDLSNHLVAITTGFTGTDVLLFGAVQDEGDIIVTVRGPDQDMVVRRKERTAGIWVNRESATFKNVPAYYASASNRSMDIIANDNVLKDYRIGLKHQRFIATSDTPDVDQKAYRAALVRNMQNVGLFNQRPAKISFLSNQLFRTDIHFPANTPTGTYMINVYLIRDGRIASVKTTPLVVSKTGVSAEVYDFAHRYSALYGIIAVIIAVISGWIASVAFRKG